MGIELQAFLGRNTDLLTWGEQLLDAVVCPLDGELGMVPLTAPLFKELRTRLTPEERERLDLTDPHGSPLPSEKHAAWMWAESASINTTIALIDLFEFGDAGHERAYIFSNGKHVPVKYFDFLTFLHDIAKIEFNLEAINLEKYRGETAAESWVLMSKMEPPEGATEITYYIKRHDETRCAIYRVPNDKDYWRFSSCKE